MLTDKSSDPSISVVVPAYKSKDTISECLKALKAQQTDLDYEIIVVESSGDGTADLVRSEFPDVQLFESGERLLSGAARNLGAEQARGKILCFVDSDCMLEPLWLEKIWQIHSRSDCAAVGGAVLNGNPELAISISSYINEFSDFFRSGRMRNMHYLSTCNISYKTEIFRKFGGFDSSQPLYVDLMFNTTLSLAGEKLIFAPEITAHHLHRTTISEYLGHELRRGRAAAIARRRGLLVGSVLAKYPVLAVLTAPGLFLRKAMVFPSRYAKAYPRDVPRLIRALPWFYTALVVWHYGFLREIIAGRREASAREGAAGCTSN